MGDRLKTQKTVIVTGASGLLGRDIATHLFSLGYEVVGIDRRDDTTPDGVEVRACDITSSEQVAALMRELEARGARIYGLVNCAAIIPTTGLWDIEADAFLQTMNVNTWGTLNMSREVARSMMNSSEGRIINIASVAGYIGGLVGGPDYAASKAGVIVLTKVLALELAKHNITVNAVAPGALTSPATEVLTDEQRGQLLSRIPLGRLGDKSEIVASIANLLEANAGYITGSTLDVNGGVFLR